MAQTIPVKITWPTAINVAHGFELQVARDPGFADVALTQAVTDQHFRWDAPTQGVYHWRLLRTGEASEDDRGTFISGSFVAVNPAMNEGEPVRISWAPVEGADRYKLYVFEGGARQRLMVTADTMFLVPRLEVPLMIEMVPFVGGRRLAREFRLNESLALEGTLSKPAAGKPVADEPVVEDPGTNELINDEPTPDSGDATAAAAAETPPEPEPEIVGPMPENSAVEPEPEAVAEETTPAIEPVAEEAVVETEVVEETNSDERSYHRRTHTVYGFLLNVNETLRTQKLEIDIDSRERETGYGAGLWVNGAGGIIVAARAEYFEHTAEFEASAESGLAAPYEIHQARYLAELSVGYDLLDSLDAKQHLLSPFVSGAMTQVPLFPLEFTGAPGTLPGLSGTDYYLYGGGITYAYFTYRFAAFLEAGALLDANDKIDISYQRLLLEYYPAAGISIQLGGYARTSAVVDCADDAGVCLREGEVRTSSDEVGVTLGMGYSLF